MNIIIRKQLEPKEYLDILSLKHYNNLFFKSSYNAYIDNQSNDYDAFLLMYDNDILVSYLAIFAPFDDGVEITGYTHPEHFNHGYFHILLKKASDMYNIPFYYSICDNSPAAKHILASVNASYSHSEYIMHIKKKIRLNKNIRNISICQHEVVKHSEYVFYISDKLSDVGEAHIVIDGNLSNICDVLIYEDYRNQGYGYKLLCHIIHFIQVQYDSSYSIILQVSSKNPAACHLYLKLGFEIYEQLDYYLQTTL